MITYEFKIKNIEVEPILSDSTDVITYIAYECTATLGTKSLMQPGRCKAPDITSSDFVAYENLTEEIILSWINDSENGMKTKLLLLNKLRPDMEYPVISPTREIRTSFPWNKKI